MKLVLDTHVLLWWVGPKEKLSRGQSRPLSRASAENPVLVSEISLWEIAMLHKSGRVSSTLPLREWLEALVAPPLVVRCGISPAVAALPDFPAWWSPRHSPTRELPACPNGWNPA